jgi:hypothetical protein
MIDNDEKRKYLEEVAVRNGGFLTPQAVIEAARDPESPIHDQFEWDDSKAAHEHRQYQARKLISSVRVVFRTDSRVVSTVYYVRDPSKSANEQGYVSVARLRTDTELAREALVAEFGRAAAALRRAHELAAALEMESEVTDLIDRVQALQGRVQAEPRAS